MMNCKVFLTIEGKQTFDRMDDKMNLKCFKEKENSFLRDGPLQHKGTNQKLTTGIRSVSIGSTKQEVK